MPHISLVFCLVFGLQVTPQGSARGTMPVAVIGTLFDRGPVTDAEIDLQLLQDEHCARLFVGQSRDAQAQKKLEGCTRDLLSTHPDSEGRYRFADLAPGWYAIHFVWSMAEKPTHPRAFKRGEWGVLYSGYKDKTGKYDSFAQGRPFYISGESDVVKDTKTLDHQRTYSTPEHTFAGGEKLPVGRCPLDDRRSNRSLEFTYWISHSIALEPPEEYVLRKLLQRRSR